MAYRGSGSRARRATASGLRRRTEERVAAGLCPRCGERPPAPGAQPVLALRRENATRPAAPATPACALRENPVGIRRRPENTGAGGCAGEAGRAPDRGPLYPVRPGSPPAPGSVVLRTVLGEKARGRARQIRRRQGCGAALRRRRMSRCQAAGRPGPEPETAPEGAHRGRALHPLRETAAGRGRDDLHSRAARQETGGRKEAVCRTPGRRDAAPDAAVPSMTACRAARPARSSTRLAGARNGRMPPRAGGMPNEGPGACARRAERRPRGRAGARRAPRSRITGPTISRASRSGTRAGP